MPVSIRKQNGGYEVRTPHGVKAKRTSKKKAESQKRLLNAIERDPAWRPTKRR